MAETGSEEEESEIGSVGLQKGLGRADERGTLRELPAGGESVISQDSILAMPSPGTKLAPEKFQGDFRKVQEFVQHFEKLCVQYSVTDSREICEAVLRYCSRRERETIRALAPFQSRDWPELRSAILTLYDADLDVRRFKVRDLETLTSRQMAKSIRNLAQWRKYCRIFLRVGGSLKNNGKISEKEYKIRFWEGIPKDLQRKLEDRILARDPLRPLKEPFEMDELDNMANAIFQRGRFDDVFGDSEDESSEGEETSLEGSSDSSDWESEDEKRHRSRKKTRGRFKKRENSEADKGELETRTNQDEVVTLLKEMSLLSRDDPAYGIAYYKAMRLDDISAVASKPIVKTEIPAFRIAPNDKIFPPTESMYGTRATRASVYHIQTSSNAGELSPRTGIRCFGCGEIGHGVRSCPAINELISKGEMKRDITGRVTFGDGSPIQRTGWETLVQVHARKRSVGSLFVKLAKAHCEVGKGRKLGSKDHTVESDWRRIDEDSDKRKVMGDAYRLEAPTVAKRRRPCEEEYPSPQKNLGNLMMTRQGTESRGEMDDAYVAERSESQTRTKNWRALSGERLSQWKVLEPSEVTRPSASRETEINWRDSYQGHIEEESDDEYPEFEDLRALEGRHETPETADIMMRRTRPSEPDESNMKRAWSLFSKGAEYVNTQRDSEVLARDDEYRRIFLPKKEIQAERNRTGREDNENGLRSGAVQEDRRERCDDTKGEEEPVYCGNLFVRRGQTRNTQATLENRVENLIRNVGRAIEESRVELVRMADEVRELKSRWDRLVGTQGTRSQSLAPRMSSTRRGSTNEAQRTSRETSD